jgi:hypothetical protein
MRFWDKIVSKKNYNVVTEVAIFVPIVILFLPIGFTLAILSMVILLIPGYVFHVYMFCKSIKWWSKNRRDITNSK